MTGAHQGHRWLGGFVDSYGVAWMMNYGGDGQTICFTWTPSLQTQVDQLRPLNIDGLTVLAGLDVNGAIPYYCGGFGFTVNRNAIPEPIKTLLNVLTCDHEGRRNPRIHSSYMEKYRPISEFKGYDQMMEDFVWRTKVRKAESEGRYLFTILH